MITRSCWYDRAGLAGVIPDLTLAGVMLPSENLHQLVNKAGLDRLKYAYVLRKHGDTAKAAALVAEADRVARTLAEQQPDTSELRVELAAGFGDASGR